MMKVSVKVYKYITIVNIDNEQQNKWRLVELKEVDRNMDSSICHYPLVQEMANWVQSGGRHHTTTWSGMFK